METAIDPVCQMKVQENDTPKFEYDFHGVTYHFCSSFCMEEFIESPLHFID